MANPRGRPPGPPKFCTIEGCNRRLKARGWCAFHYQRWQQRGDALWEPDVLSPVQLFVTKVAGWDGDGCWEWTAGKTDGGYGKFTSEGTTHLAHRFSYRMWIGPIPDDLPLDHLCRVRHCVKPAHLEPVTTRENNRRSDSGAWQRAKTHCPQGHEYTLDNIYWYGDSRRCRVCYRQRSHDYYHTKVKVNAEN